MLAPAKRMVLYIVLYGNEAAVMSNDQSLGLRRSTKASPDGPGEPAFDTWLCGVDAPSLRLIRTRSGKVVEWVEIDLRDLPARLDLLGRIAPSIRRRLLAEAALLPTREAA
ncbi:hypothetical protein GCM10025759_19410 [Lysobacter panacisoli]|uniref:GIY-YIG nuclease family protein n=1 Tax=Lysobacter panacisoli TaxID=1255263 RepID=A0ABP9LCK9_9GAMM